MAVSQLQGQQGPAGAPLQMIMQGFGELANQRNQRRVNLVKQVEEYAATHGGFANMLASQGEEGSRLLDQYLTEGLGLSRRELPQVYNELQKGANPDELLYAARMNSDITEYMKPEDNPQPDPGPGPQPQPSPQGPARFDLNAPTQQGWQTTQHIEGTMTGGDTVDVMPGVDEFNPTGMPAGTPLGTTYKTPKKLVEQETLEVSEENTMTRLMDLDAKIRDSFPRGVPTAPGSEEWEKTVYRAISSNMGLDQGNVRYGYLLGKNPEDTKKGLEIAGKTEEEVLTDVAAETGIKFQSLEQMQYFRQVMGQAQLDKAKGLLKDPAEMQLRIDAAKAFGREDLSDEQKFAGLFDKLPYETVVDGQENPSKGKTKAAAAQVNNQMIRDIKPFARDIRRLYQNPQTANEFMRTARMLRQMEPEEFYGRFRGELAKDLDIEKMRGSAKDREYKDALISFTEAQTRYQDLQSNLMSAQQDADPETAAAAMRLQTTIGLLDTAMKNYDNYSSDFQKILEKDFMDIMKELGVSSADMQLIQKNGFFRALGGSDLKSVFTPAQAQPVQQNPLTMELYTQYANANR